MAVAKLVASESDTPDDYNFNHVAAGVAVLAAIAASDAICCALLGERARGQDHRDAAELLANVRYGTGSESVREQRSRQLAQALLQCLDLKDQSHYGVSLLGKAQVRTLIRCAEKLVNAAAEALR